MSDCATVIYLPCRSTIRPTHFVPLPLELASEIEERTRSSQIRVVHLSTVAQFAAAAVSGHEATSWPKRCQIVSFLCSFSDYAYYEYFIFLFHEELTTWNVV